MRKLINLVSYLTIILAMGLVVYAYYLSFYPFKVVQLNSFTVTTTEPIYRGGYIEYNLDFDKLLPIKPRVTYFLVDGIIVELEGTGINQVVGEQKVTRSRRIPETVNPGVYKFRIELEYPVAPWRTINYTWISNEFTVL